MKKAWLEQVEFVALMMTLGTMYVVLFASVLAMIGFFGVFKLGNRYLWSVRYVVII